MTLKTIEKTIEDVIKSSQLQTQFNISQEQLEAIDPDISVKAVSIGIDGKEESKDVFIWSHDQTELGYFNKILNILTSTNILKRKREYAELHPKIKNRYYMFYKLEKEVDMRIIRAMNTLYKEGYYSNANIWDVKLVHVDDGILLDMNDRINKLEESNKVLSQELKRISENFDF